MSESPVELARVRDDSCCRVEDTLKLVGRLLRSTNHETAAVIDAACDRVTLEGSVEMFSVRTSKIASAELLIVHISSGVCW